MSFFVRLLELRRQQSALVMLPAQHRVIDKPVLKIKVKAISISILILLLISIVHCPPLRPVSLSISILESNSKRFSLIPSPSDQPLEKAKGLLQRSCLGFSLSILCPSPILLPRFICPESCDSMDCSYCMHGALDPTFESRA